MPPLETIFLLGVLGLLLGSFGNVLVLRDENRESILFERSKCPRCGKTLGALELVPIISWVFQGGRCRGCRALISPYYALGELLGASWGVLAAFVFPYSLPAALFLLGALWLLGVMAAIDIRTQTVLPEYVALMGLFGAFAFSLGGVPGMMYETDMLRGALVAVAFFTFVLLFWKLTTKNDGMGIGDVWVAGALGLWFGFPGVLVALVVAVCSATVFGLGMMGVDTLRRNRNSEKTSTLPRIPMIPFFAFGALICLLWGTELISWYYGVVGII